MKHLILSLLSVLGVSVAYGDPDDGYPRWGGPRVTVYQHADFRGASRTLLPGEALENLAREGFEDGGVSNDRISSIRIEGGAELLVYENARYGGRVLRLTERVRNLADRLLPESVSASWNDRISSLRVESRRSGPGRGDGRISRARADEIVRNAFLDLLLREPDLRGPNVYRDLIMNQGWTDQMVRDNIRRGEEFRLQGAERIVRQAYLEVLGREVDPSGLAAYRDRLFRYNWTGHDVRESLRRSEEYRRLQAGR